MLNGYGTLYRAEEARVGREEEIAIGEGVECSYDTAEETAGGASCQRGISVSAVF